MLDAAVDQVLPASTGVIGMELDPRLITKALPKLVKQLKTGTFESVASAIMTTTTLGFVITDAELSPAALRGILTAGIETSFNRVSVDGDTSNNDTVVLMANGACGVKLAASGITDAVREVLEDLARQIARDGEGARKLVTIDVRGAADNEAAQRLARAIANSPLVKTAIAGSDANWGRILSAADNAVWCSTCRKSTSTCKAYRSAPRASQQTSTSLHSRQNSTSRNAASNSPSRAILPRNIFELTRVTAHDPARVSLALRHIGAAAQSRPRIRRLERHRGACFRPG